MQPSQPSQPSQPDQTVKAHFLNLYAIALSDSHLDPAELEFLFRLGEERGVSKDELQKLLMYPVESDFVVPDTVREKITYLYDFARLIWADGQIDDHEVRSLESFCRKFGFAEENVSQIARFLIDMAKKDSHMQTVLEIVRQTQNTVL